MNDLERISTEFLDPSPDREVDAYISSVIAERVTADLEGETAIELGVGDLVWTPHLLEKYGRVLTVDASVQLMEIAAARYDPARWTGVVSYFEEFDPSEPADLVLATYVLEHVDDPAAVIRRSRTWLRPEGQLVVVVPSAGGLHRRLAQVMGLIDDPTVLGDTDRRLGHKRVFTVESLVAEIEASGFRIDKVEGFLAKTLPNSLLTACTQAQLAGLVDVGRQLPVEFAAAICVHAVPDGN